MQRPLGLFLVDGMLLAVCYGGACSTALALPNHIILLTPIQQKPQEDLPTKDPRSLSNSKWFYNAVTTTKRQLNNLMGFHRKVTVLMSLCHDED